MEEAEKVEKDTQVTPVKKEHVVEKRINRQMPTWFPWVAAALGALLIALIGYGIGAHNSRFGINARTGFNGGMMRGADYDDHIGTGAGLRTRGIMGGTIGEVTAVSSDSITLTDTMRGGSVTYKIDSNTKVTENGTTKAVSDIKTGNTVRVAATGSDRTIATDIVLGIN